MHLSTSGREAINNNDTRTYNGAYLEEQFQANNETMFQEFRVKGHSRVIENKMKMKTGIGHGLLETKFHLLPKEYLDLFIEGTSGEWCEMT